MSTLRRAGALVSGLTLITAGLAAVTSPAQADVSTAISSLPYSQDWSDGSLITAPDDWSGVPGVQGYKGEGLTSGSTTDPQTITADGSSTETDVIAGSSAGSTSGGVHEIDGDTIALQGSGSANAPHVVFRLDLTDNAGTSFAFDARDIDVSDATAQQIAVQYRIGATGDYTNLPDGYIADATADGGATLVTPRNVALPAATDGQADVFVRVITADAPSSDGMVGIDNIVVSDGVAGPAQPQADCGDGALVVDSGASGSRDVSATDADSRVVTGEITSAPVDGITLDGFTASAGNGDAAIATLNVADTTADGSYEVEIEFTTNDDQTATCTVTVEVRDLDAVTVISDIQGDGAVSPLVDETVNVEAIATSLITSNDALNGFFLQEEDADTDGEDGTSEGVYVFCGSDCPEVAAGDQIRVRGEVEEFFGNTQINASGDGTFDIRAGEQELPATAVVELPAATSTEDAATFEHVEGMRTTISTTLAVSEYFNQARFGEIVLTANERPYQFTQTDDPDVAEFEAFNAALAKRRIILDDDSNSQNAATSGPDSNEPYYYPAPGLSTENYFRGGDTITDLTGVFEYSFGAWKLRPVAGEDYTFEATNPRTESAPDVGGRLTVASFNVLNYFATIDETSSSSSGPCGPNGDQDCRGADSDAERVRQLDKIVAALAEIDADVFGLIEIENDEGQATQQIVDALNTATGGSTYDYVDTGFTGSDVIRQAFIYNTDTVSPVGDFDLLTSADDPKFDEEKNRPALIQTFEETASGERVTVAVNHLKSKGSGCGAGDDAVDGSGNCDGTRTAAAEALADHLAGDPTETGESDTLIIGDLNSYAMERPITTLRDAGYTDLLQEFEGEDAYGYLFDGQLGTLDYGLANDSLLDQVTGASGWAINADENPLFDYNDTVLDTGEASFERESDALPLYEPTPFRASDHDPVIIGLELGGDLPEPLAEVDMDIDLKPGKVEAGKTRPRLEVEVEDAENRRQTVSGVVRVSFEDEVRTETLQRGKALFELGTFDTPGEVTVTVEYLGSDTHAPRTETFTFQVRDKKGKKDKKDTDRRD